MFVGIGIGLGVTLATALIVLAYCYVKQRRKTNTQLLSQSGLCRILSNRCSNEDENEEGYSTSKHHHSTSKHQRPLSSNRQTSCVTDEDPTYEYPIPRNEAPVALSRDKDNGAYDGASDVSDATNPYDNNIFQKLPIADSSPPSQTDGYHHYDTPAPPANVYDIPRTKADGVQKIATNQITPNQYEVPRIAADSIHKSATHIYQIPAVTTDRGPTINTTKQNKQTLQFSDGSTAKPSLSTLTILSTIETV